MKKIYLGIAMLFVVFMSHAQWNNNGNNSTTGDLTVRNPNNNNASMTLSWLDDIPRIRLGGTGNGSANGFEIQSIGNKKLFKVNQAADVFVYGKLGIGITTPKSKLDLGTNYSNPGTYPNKITLWSSGENNYFGFGISNADLDYFSQHNHRFYTGYNGTAGSEKMVIQSNGNVGIGTNSPSAKLDITNGTYKTYFTGNAMLFKNSDVASYIDKRDAGRLIFRMGENYNHIMTLASNLNVGIGTTVPTEKLDIRGNVSSTGTLSLGNIASSSSLRDVISLYDNRLGKTNMYGFGVEGDGTLYNKAVNNHRWYISKNADGGTSAKMELSDSKLFVSGNVGIGTKDPKGYKLAVAGSKGIIAEEVTVKLKSAWPDYVFANDYKLPTLREVENHIKEKGHLANIPSAKEVKENGVKLGEINTKLLEKVEELTLYTIQQEKKLEKQHNEIEELKSLVKQLIDTKK